MKRYLQIVLVAPLLASFSVLLGSSEPSAQQSSLKDQITGTWLLVSNDNIAPNGQRRQLFGPNPKGMVILHGNGHFTQIYLRPDRPKFKASSRLRGTPEEIKSAWDGMVALFGTWSTNDADRTILMRIQGHSFPNSEGRESKRTISALTSDQLAWFTIAPAAGGRSESIFRRIK